uniref:Integrase, catalytic region, zinc finger, CCHC-type, peptidase aspartic, catalytic n=1 Tax=Tanacetum cinerariifolium TaxID=118510 RepID=A0A699L505_TANCI|nr:integrase, catalytic region, zinc finger, CCHC-type, peptidase aspartic, catalytic [Tanacetum cinerariifolium]
MSLLFYLLQIVQICLWIIDSGCSKHITGNRALLTNFLEKFLETFRFGNNDFAVIAGYGDVVTGSMMIKKVYYVEGLGHNLFSVGQFCDKGLKVAFRKSTCFVRNEDGVDLLTGDRSSNLYTIALNEGRFIENITSPQRVRTDNGTEFKNKTLAKFFDEVGITQQFSAARMPQQNAQGKGGYWSVVGYSKEFAAFRIYNKRTRKIHESVNVNFDEISEMASKQFSLELSLSKLNEKGKSLNPSIMKSSTTNVETSINEEVFHESISNNMIPNGDEAITSHNVFNKRLEDAYFAASTSFHDPSNVNTFYQPYPHENKWAKDHPLYKIIGDSKSSVRTRGQLENSCLFSCLLSFIELANVVEALRDADWVSAMQEELDQFARLKV